MRPLPVDATGQYHTMLRTARLGGPAYSSSRVALRVLADSESDGMFKMDVNIGNKRSSDSHDWLVQGEQSICDRIKRASAEIGGTGKPLITN